MAYITRLSHFKFEKEGDELVISSERDESFEARFSWPDDLAIDDEDLAPELHERYYTEVAVEYRDN